MATDRQAIEVITANTRIPYALISEEVEGSSSDILSEFREIIEYYKVYEKGAKFTTEGSQGDYLPSTLRFRTAASLINKQARFLFGETPDVLVTAKGDLGKITEESKAALTVQQDLVTTVLKKNKFSKNLLQAAKDCLIAKRVACVVNFNEDEGITVSFLSSLNFMFEVDPRDTDRLTKFVAFTVLRRRSKLADVRVYKKKFEMQDGICHMQEAIYDGAGTLVEMITEYQPTYFERIPAVVITNDGLTGDVEGVSEIKLLADMEELYSKLANADVDAERKGMNQVVYTIDMDEVSTKGLSRAPGSYWDLQRNVKLDDASPKVGTVESNMNYSDSLSTTLDRLKSAMYSQVDVPMIDIESMSGTITSGKALKAVYWPLIVRCKEKMQTWAPQLETVAELIIEGAMLYPETAKQYTNDFITPVASEIKVVSNYPLPEDEAEEKEIDLSEVTAQTMSRKSYMRKWRELTDEQADEELKQLAYERQLLEDGFDVPPMSSDDTVQETVEELDEESEGFQFTLPL